ncbi:MAG: PEP/pyruvate-binding domain-containing protein [bacterium]
MNCLYKIEEILNKPEISIDDACMGIIRAIPPGWQYPEKCRVKIIMNETIYQESNFVETPWVLNADLMVRDKIVGKISVYYTEEMPKADKGPFLKEEEKLLKTIADRLSHFIMYRRMRQIYNEYQSARRDISEHRIEEWRVALNILHNTDRNLFFSISQRMLNHLSWSGISEAEQLLKQYSMNSEGVEIDMLLDENQPFQKTTLKFTDEFSDEIFKIAMKYLSNEQILSFISKWIQEDRFSFITQVVNQNSSFWVISDAIRRFRMIAPEGTKLPHNIEKGIQVSLIQRLLSDQLDFIKVAKKYIEIEDFYEMIDHTIYFTDSMGKFGGKSAGLLLAKQIIKKSGKFSEILKDIKFPKTWYIPSDVLLDFLKYNNLIEVVEQKYKDINQVRLEYPHIIRTFKDCQFPPDIMQGLSMALDDFKESPLIIRSSSLLEDRAGAAFSGKYKSLFLANQGSKNERLLALADAIAEVYASIYGPDPIEYRSERGLLDFSEEMAIMIQNVVGHKVGNYFFPLFAGVAFSRNEFRWSPRIKREDGLIRMVLGLGTRAVDRVSEDYPILIAPGQPNLRVNVTVDEIVRYTPKMIDVINLNTKTFETISINELLKRFGDNIPNIEKVVSIYDGYQIREPLGKNILFDKDDIIITFNGLVSNTNFVEKIKCLLKLLEDELGTPVDIEFASDGIDFYLLQCRSQSYSESQAPSPIPQDIPKDRIIFTANKYISNGRIPDITHIVYIDPKSYDEITDHSTLVAVGRAVGKLNQILPRRKFILMGPGRWGSRGDIKLGVRVIYSDINNTAVLIEIARKKGGYLPDLSFGTHFFQDLVEADIHYIPLYPDDEGVIFNERFLRGAENIFPNVLPEFEFLSDTIRLIDVPKVMNGHTLRILMNADLDKAVGYIVEPSISIQPQASTKSYFEKQEDNYWVWRLQMAEYIALQLDAERFGVKGLYVIGSTKNATAGPASDIDILVHFKGTKKQKRELLLWFEGWSLALDEMNYQKTGYRTGGLLDIHIVTDEDIEKKTSYALKINAMTDAARPLPMKKK